MVTTTTTEKQRQQEMKQKKKTKQNINGNTPAAATALQKLAFLIPISPVDFVCAATATAAAATVRNTQHRIHHIEWMATHIWCWFGSSSKGSGSKRMCVCYDVFTVHCSTSLNLYLYLCHVVFFSPLAADTILCFFPQKCLHVALRCCRFSPTVSAMPDAAEK